MSEPKATPSAGTTPSKQLAGFIARFDPAVARLARSARAALRKRLPTANELVYDNYNALAIGFGPTERTWDCIVSLAVYARGVNLYFLYGATLRDPNGLLQGKGNRGRFIRLAAAENLDQPPVKELLREAVRQSDEPFPKRGGGKLVIKSVSAKQRPRRGNR